MQKFLSAGPGPVVSRQIPKSTLNYHLKQFEAQGLIKREVNSRPIIWSLTGQSPNFSIPDDNPNILRFHHAQMRFKVLSWGAFPKETQESLVGGFRNNPYFHRKYRGLTFRFFEDSIIAFCPEIYANHEAQAYAQATFKVMNVMQDLANRYDIQLGPPEFCRRPHIAIVNNTFTESLGKWCKAKGIYPDFGDFWVDESTDTEFETSQLFKAQQFINGMATMPGVFADLVPVMTELSAQIKLHLTVMQDIKDGVSKQTAIFEQIKDVLERFKP